MVSQWRQIGMSYLQYSAICARAVRRCLKPEFKSDSSRLDQTNIKVTKWAEGKPGKAIKYESGWFTWAQCGVHNTLEMEEKSKNQKSMAVPDLMFGDVQLC